MYTLFSLIERKLYSVYRFPLISNTIRDFYDNPSNFLQVKENPSSYISTLQKSAKRFQKVVIWGLRSVFHTHRFIHLGFYNTLKECGINVIWCDDVHANNDIIKEEEIITEKKLKLQGKALWIKEDFLELEKYNNSLTNLLADFPKNYLYLHPIKLSKWEL